MRHRNKKNNFNRTSAHRQAMLRNMVISLFAHRRIKTTPQKAKSARQLAEKMITLAKKAHLAAEPKDALHLRRQAISRLGGNKAAVKLLFAEIGPMYVNRNGGYTRILRLPGSLRLPSGESGTRSQSGYRRAYGWRLGDGAEQVYLELVEAEVQDRPRRPRKKRRRKKAGGAAEKATEDERAAETSAEESPDAGQVEET
jgi:large subunit ribosomal protein L17